MWCCDDVAMVLRWCCNKSSVATSQVTYPRDGSSCSLELSFILAQAAFTQMCSHLCISSRLLHCPGTPLDLTRAVCDCGPGGAVILSSESFHRAMQLGQQGLRWCATINKRSPRNSPNSGTARVWQQQQQQLSGPLPDELSASVLRTLAGSVALYAGDHQMQKLDAGAKPMPLFMAVPGELEARLPHLPPMRYTKVWTILFPGMCCSARPPTVV